MKPQDKPDTPPPSDEPESEAMPQPEPGQPDDGLERFREAWKRAAEKMKDPKCQVPY